VCERACLEALAVAGGAADAEDLERVVQRREPDCDVERCLAQLEDRAWLRRLTPKHIETISATHRTVIAAAGEERRPAWHRVWMEVLADSSRPLALASAALHAAGAADWGATQALARRAATAARVAGLEDTATSLESFAGGGDAGSLKARGLVRRGDLELLEVITRRLEEERPPPISVRPDRVDPAVRALAALRSGDSQSVAHAAAELRDGGERGPLADRLEAIAALSKGDTAGALRRIRTSRERFPSDRPADRCRAALAHGVALAAAERLSEALLEGLDALARAREVGDPRAAEACLRFLEQLSEHAGDEGAARKWRAARLGEDASTLPR
jgi:hypothetical protein